MNNKFIPLLSSAFALFTASVPSAAFADCDDVGSPDWNALQNDMNQQFEQGNLDEALNAGKQLTLICDKNPIVNAVISDIYDKKGMQDESYKYIRRASDVANEYNLPLPLLEKIWFKRAEFELPYKAKSEKLQKDLDEKIAECSSQTEAFQQMLLENTTLSQKQLDKSIAESQQRYRDDFLKVQWIGTGIATAGGLIAIAGGAVMGLYYPEANREYKKLKNNEKNHFQHANQSVEAGIGTLAAGLGIAIAGSAAAIYASLKLKENAPKDEPVAVELRLSPTHIGLNMAF